MLPPDIVQICKVVILTPLNEEVDPGTISADCFLRTVHSSMLQEQVQCFGGTNRIELDFVGVHGSHRTPEEALSRLESPSKA